MCHSHDFAHPCALLRAFVSFFTSIEKALNSSLSWVLAAQQGDENTDGLITRSLVYLFGTLNPKS